MPAPDDHPHEHGGNPGHPTHHERELERWDLDNDGAVTDTDLALAPPPPFWRRFGLRGPAIVLRWFTRNAKRLAVLVLGGAVLAAGVAMLVLPGPGVIIVLVGLAILATEFAWAERALDATTRRASKAASTVSASPAGRWLLVVSGACLVVAGVATAVALPAWRVAGVSLVVAGLVALATLAPPVQAWLDRQQARDRAAERARP
jgi:uncharacterized protein (TIGR02611 family)